MSMSTKKCKPNAKCPCGSGKKFKKCCRKVISASKDKKVTPEENQRFMRHLYTLRSVKHEALEEDYCEVRESPIAGKGLFATSDIPAWSLVTWYPVHCLEHSKELYENQAFHMFQPINGELFDKVEMIESERHRLDKYRYVLNGLCNNDGVKFKGFQTSICGDPNIENPYELGHFVNDACFLSENPSSNEIQLYMQKESAANVMPYHFGFYRLAIITTKQIKCGDELLLSYGANYWSQNCSDIVKKSQCLRKIALSNARKIEHNTAICQKIYKSGAVNLEMVHNILKLRLVMPEK